MSGYFIVTIFLLLLRFLLWLPMNKKKKENKKALYIYIRINDACLYKIPQKMGK